jgi:hypothetical protein
MFILCVGEMELINILQIDGKSVTFRLSDSMRFPHKVCILQIIKLHIYSSSHIEKTVRESVVVCDR